MAPRMLCLALLLGVACGDDDRVPTDAAPRDGGSPGDAFTDEDAAIATDGGAGSDMGAGTDAGVEEVDGGSTMDDGGPLADCVDGPLTLDSERSATTIGGADVRDPNGSDCVAGFATGPERVFSFTAPDADDFRVTVTPTNGTYDPMIYVQPSCDDSTACIAGSNLNGAGTMDSTTMSLEADQTVLITVDTDLGGDIGGGPFTILVERAL